MAEDERPQDDTEPTEGDEQAAGNGAKEPDRGPPFAKGWRWPLIILVAGIIAMGALVTLFTQPEPPPPPPPLPPPPPPGVVVPRV